MTGNCVWVGDYDPPSVSRSVLRRARKAHRCGECRQPIPVGALHEYATGCWEGAWSTHRTCARCVNVRTDYFREGWVYGAVVEDFQAAFGFSYLDGIPPGFAPCKGLP